MSHPMRCACSIEIGDTTHTAFLSLRALAKIETYLDADNGRDLGTALAQAKAKQIVELVAIILRDNGIVIDAEQILASNLSKKEALSFLLCVFAGNEEADQKKKLDKWQKSFQYALHYLRLQPSEFWSLSLTEWQALVAPLADDLRMHRSDLEALMNASDKNNKLKRENSKDGKH